MRSATIVNPAQLTRPRRPRGLVAVIALAVLLSACAADPPPVHVPSPSPPASASPTPSAVPVSTPATPSPVAQTCSNQSMLARWSDAELAWQVIVVPVQLTALATVRPEVSLGAGGIVVFGSTAPADLARQLAGLPAASPRRIGPLVMSDLEGGAVERAVNLLGTMPSARALAQTMTPTQIRAFATAAGRRMRAIGITMDLAPVMDLDAGFGPTATDPDGTRSFGPDPGVTAVDASAFAAGLKVAGVVAVAKHFPGLHGAGDNTDAGPAQTAPWPALQQTGLVPFETAIAGGVPAVMLSNASVPGLTSLPASISPAVVAALRHQLGFAGLIVTDSLSAGALADIGFSVARAATAALIAGADMILYNGVAADAAPNARATAAAIEAALAQGALPRSQLIGSVARVLAAKRVDLCAHAAS